MAGRFSFQMPERRGYSTPWFTIGQLEVTTTVFATLAGAISMVMWSISPALVEAMALLPDRVTSGEVWRLITWPLANSPHPWTIIGLAIFWYFGRELESVTGRNRFAWFLGILTFVPAVVATFLSVPQAGLRPLQFSIFLIFIAQNPMARFFFGIPAWALGAMFLMLEILQLVGLRLGRSIVFLFVSLATAAIAARSYGLMERLNFIPTIALPGSEARTKKAASAPRKAPKQPKARKRGETIVQGPWDAPSGPHPADRTVLQKEMDGLLDKISAEGMDALSLEEKRRLNELSKLLR
jgi:hypothetical protein